jgi:hypothetical protein
MVSKIGLRRGFGIGERILQPVVAAGSGTVALLERATSAPG